MGVVAPNSTPTILLGKVGREDGGMRNKRMLRKFEKFLAKLSIQVKQNNVKIKAFKI